jgi:uncharacterized protein (TIGR02444 family)
MTDTQSSTEAEGWEFALRIYAQPGFADACLNLQEAAGADVMLLLMSVFFAAKRRILLTSSEIRELDRTCSPWREQVIRPLRAVRKGLKVGPPPAPDAETEQLRSKIKLAELTAERQQNRLMAQHLALLPDRRDQVQPADIRTVVRRVVELALENGGGAPLPEQLASIDTIAEAASCDSQ